MYLTRSWQRRGPAAVDVPWLLLSLLVTSAVAAADALLPPEPVLSGLLVVGPAVACARLDIRRTSLVCGYALLLALGLGFLNDRIGSVDHMLRLAVLLIGSGLTLFLAHSRTIREESLATVARMAQHAILQPFSARVGGVDIAIRYRSADRDALVGGDLFDVANTAYGVRVLIGDARGKGLSSTVTAAAALRAFRNAAYTEPTAAAVTGSVAAALTGRLPGEDFVTAAVAEFTHDRATVVNHGHHAPVLLGQRQPEFLLPPDTVPPLGLGLDGDPEPRRLRLAPGEAVLLYTDGLAEARDDAGEMFDVLAGCGKVPPDTAPDRALDLLLQQLDAHTGGERDDDVALVLCRPVLEEPPEDPATGPRAAGER
ncbi:PP2C family protein-serine/threonine phosphatase [Streptomyces sp. TR02-1]|uniref:PP2C family protein-serine/threonine phosphatase n=1 Tax=Streptomyces sp. TR02-1 TaxID=3385977 RepID=UPI00399F04AE